MEIQRTPVTLEQRMEYLNQAATNAELNKKPFPWLVVIISGLIGGGLCLVAFYWRKKKDSEK